jgi:Protein of unknown function (DUF3313)
MRIRPWFVIACGVALIAGAPDAPAQASTDADGLTAVKSGDFDRVYLRPGADFRSYNKLLVSATEVSFAADWLSNMNLNPIAVLQGTTANDAARIAEETRQGLQTAFANTLRHAGYEIVAAPAEGVLAISVRVVDLFINAPSTVTQALPSRVLTRDAGRATLVLEIRDSTSGVLLGRVVDRRTAGNRGSSRRDVRQTTTVTNRFDFGSLFDLWAWYSIDLLKVTPPLAMSAPAQTASR